MDWNQVLTIVGTNIALIFVSLGSTISLFIWTRTEANSDRRQIQEEMRVNRESFQEEMRVNRQETMTLIKEIQAEVKNFNQKIEELKSEIKK